MRSLLIILCLLALAAPAVAQAPDDIAAADEPQDAPRLKQLGFVLETGLPNGMMGSVVYRPLGWLRTHLGAGYNLVSVGLQGGATLIPFGWGPSLTLEAGHYFEGDANGLVRMASAGFEDSVLLERVGYDYASAHLGLEFGEETFTFFVHGGMSYVAMDVNNIDVALQDATGSDASGPQLRIDETPSVSAFVPSLKFGFLMYVW
jgi:hypothetical protein